MNKSKKNLKNLIIGRRASLKILIYQIDQELNQKKIEVMNILLEHFLIIILIKIKKIRIIMTVIVVQVV